MIATSEAADPSLRESVRIELEVGNRHGGVLVTVIQESRHLGGQSTAKVRARRDIVAFPATRTKERRSDKHDGRDVQAGPMLSERVDQDGAPDRVPDDDCWASKCANLFLDGSLPKGELRVGLVRHARVLHVVPVAQRLAQARHQPVVPMVVGACAGALNKQHVPHSMIRPPWLARFIGDQARIYPSCMHVQLPARPEPVAIELARTAVVLVDMQNAFASKGGLLDLAGIDVSGSAAAVANAGRLLDTARVHGIPVIYLVMGFPADQSTGGGDESPNPQKELALRLMRERPELRGKLLTFGTWDFAIVDQLSPQPGDQVIVKPRYSGFYGTPLDAVLRGRGIRYLLMAGIASNVCVESTLRDAFFHEYWPIMIEDATMAGGPPEIQRATVYNVETFFGWVCQTEDVATALGASRHS